MDWMPLVWAVLGILLILSEFAIPGLAIAFFGIGALITAVFSFIPGIHGNILLQLLSFMTFSVLSLVTLRKYFKKWFYGSKIEVDTDKDIGQRVNVIDEITPDKPGRIKYAGTTWKAVSFSETFRPGDTVEILKKENLSYIVTKSISGDFLEEK